MDSFPQSFYAELSKSGIEYSDTRTPALDGKVHRFKAKGDKEANSWYILFDNGNGFIAGKYGCWKRGFTNQYTSLDRTGLSKEDSQKLNARWREAEAARKLDEKETQDNARNKVKEIIASASSALSHPYLAAKGFETVPNVAFPVYISNDLLTEGWLILPLRDVDGIIHSAQFIADDGTKRFQYGGRVKGCYYDLSERASGPIVICEGYATGLSVFAATGWSVKCAMNSGNLLAVAKDIATSPENSKRQIFIAADNDQFTDGNPGLTKAREVVKALPEAVLSFPEFSDSSLENSPTDFNDLHRLEGLLYVEIRLKSSMPVVARFIGDLIAPPEDDPTEILKTRYICQRGGLLISGPTGMGKSSFLLQAYALWSNAMAFFGIRPVRPLRCLLIQAENDDGDLAAMRDGVCTGLGFTEEQRKTFFRNVLVHTSAGITGKAFCSEVVARLLDLYSPLDLLGIDPALSFVGGDVKEQKVVGDFLRTYLNPLLWAHECACTMLHHSNKPPSGREKPEWRNGDMAYIGSGSAEWANWARAILSLQSTGIPGLYQLHAAKRGSKLGWKESDESTITYQKTIAWSKESNIICWREADMIETAKASEKGRKSKYTVDDILELLEGSTTGLPTTEWQLRAKQERGVSNATFYRLLDDIREMNPPPASKSIINDRWTLNT